MSLLHKLLHELKAVALVTLYFLSCFGVIVLLKKLLLAEYDIRMTAAGTAAVGALVTAKVVVILDATTAGERLSRGRVLAHVVYKSLVYTLVVGLVVTAEHYYHAFREAGSWSGGWTELWTVQHAQHMAFTVTCVLLAFIGYNVFSEVDRHLGGKGALRAFLMSRREERAP